MSEMENTLKKPVEKKASKSANVLKAGVGYVISQLIVKGASFICTPLFSRLLSKATFGEVKIYEGWLQILLPIFTLSLYTSIERAKYEFKDELDNYVSSVQMLIMLTVAALFVCSLPVLGIVCEILDMSAAMYVTMFLYFITNAAILNYQRRIKLDYRYKASMFLSLMNTVPSLLIAMISVIISKYLINSNGTLLHERILGFYWPQIAVGGFVVYLLLKKGKKWFNKRYWEFALKFSVPMIPSQVSVSVLNQSSQIMIEKFTNAENTALFSMASTVMYILYVIETAIGDAWLPWLFEKLNTKEYDKLQKPWLLILLGTSLMSWGCIMFAPELILVLGSPRYAESVYIVAPVVTGALFHFFTFSYINIEKFHNSTKTIAFASVMAMIINLILNYFGIQWFGYQAAAYTSMICYFLIMMFQAVMVKVITGEYIISLTNTLAVSFGATFINLVTMLILDLNFFARFGICVVILIAALVIAQYVFKVDLKGIVKMLRKKIGGKK